VPVRIAQLAFEHSAHGIAWKLGDEIDALGSLYEGHFASGNLAQLVPGQAWKKTRFS
jgi:hypothetical protein